jgi:hypothetical protein
METIRPFKQTTLRHPSRICHAPDPSCAFHRTTSGIESRKLMVSMRRRSRMTCRACNGLAFLACVWRASTGTKPARMSPVSTRSVGIKVYLADIFSCADGANTAGTRSRKVSIDREVLSAFPCVTVETFERMFMMGFLRDVFGRDCPHPREHVARSCQLRGDGTWNKWRGPALRGEVAVYAAKARRRSIDQRARRGKLSLLSNPALPVSFLLLLLRNRDVSIMLSRQPPLLVLPRFRAAELLIFARQLPARTSRLTVQLGWRKAAVGATAQSHDGSYSLSEHRRGTCSHRGGVST